MIHSPEFVHFGISVTNLARSVQWYCKNLGFTEVKRFEKPELQIKGAILALGNGTLEILEPARPAKPDKIKGTLQIHLQRIGANHLAIGVDDLSTYYERLKQKNVKFVSEIVDNRFFFCKDPDEMLLEIRQT
ncbi:MAG: VOC family protein [bacterium]